MAMTLDQVVQQASLLSPEDKRELIRVMADALTHQDESNPTPADQELLELLDRAQVFPVWSPYDSYEAANVLKEFLDNLEHADADAGGVPLPGDER